MKQERASNSSVDEGEDEPAELELDASVGDSIEPAQRMTLLQRVEAVEAFAGFIFALIFTAAAGLVGIALIAQGVFRLGLRGSTEAFAGGAALLLVVVVHWRFVMSLEGDLVESDEEMTPAVMIARVRRGSMLRRLVVALWFGALAAVLLAFAHYWSGLFHVRGGGWKSALATIVGALLLFIGAFASNAALQGSLAAIGVGDRVLAWLWRHRFGLDASVAIIGVTLPASWTPTTGGGILP